MDLETYFQNEPQGPAPKVGDPGRLTPWMSWGPFELRGRNILLIDPARGLDDEAGLLVRLAIGAYEVSLRIIEFGQDVRVAGLRLARSGKRLRKGDKLGQVQVDSARLGLCDHELAHKAAGLLGEAGSFALMQKEVREASLVGFVELDEDAEIGMPLVTTGFGDGLFDVHELLAGDIRSGLEVTFIESDAKYPFGEPGN